MIPFDAVRNIAIFRRNGLGDVLCTIPLVLRCKELMPQAKVTLFIEEKAFALASYLEGPDEVARIPSSWNKYVSAIKLGWQRRLERFDLAISAKTTPMKLMNVSLAALRAKRRLAYTQGSWHDQLINCPRKYVPEQDVHQALQAVHLIDAEMTELPERLYPRLKPVNSTRLFSGMTLLISLSNNRIGSTLTLQRLADILNALSSPFSLAMSCLPKDLGKALELAPLLKMEYKIFSSPTFGEFVTLLKSADVIFAGDGGIAHLAAALQKPSLFLFGGTKVSQWGPLSKKSITMARPKHVMDIDPAEIIPVLDMLLQKL